MKTITTAVCVPVLPMIVLLLRAAAADGIQTGPMVQMHVPGFTVGELPVSMTAQHKIEYGPDDKLYAGRDTGRRLTLQTPPRTKAVPYPITLPSPDDRRSAVDLMQDLRRNDAIENNTGRGEDLRSRGILPVPRSLEGIIQPSGLSR
jgi:hypothetical protein